MGLLKICFLCQISPVKLNAFSELEQGSAFNFLCHLLNMGAITRLKSGRKVENSEFCSSCEYRVRDAMATNHEILLLQTKLSLLQKHFKSTIMSSYRRRLMEPREELASEAEVLGRMIVQCWSRCDVMMSPIAEFNNVTTAKMKLPLSGTTPANDMEFSPKISTFSRPQSDNSITVETTSRKCSFTYQDNPPDFTTSLVVISPNNEVDDISDSDIQENDPLDMDYVKTKEEPHESDSGTSDSSYCPDDDLYSPRKQRKKSANDCVQKFSPINRSPSLKVDKQKFQGEEAPTQCPFCGVNFLSKCLVSSNNDNAPAYQCNLQKCKEKFFSLPQLWNHHRPKCSASQTQASRSFSRSSTQSSRTSDQPRSSDQPPKVESSEPKNIYCCEHCPKDFSRMNSLIIHLRFAHGDGTGETRCRSCKWDFTSLYRLVSSSESQDPIFECTMADCHLQFNSLLEFKRHHRSKCTESLANGILQANTTPKQAADWAKPAPRYECGQCDKTFLGPDSRLVHLHFAHGVGTGETRCRQCKWDFASLYRMVTPADSDVSEYECTMVDCGLKFPTLLDFKRHHRYKCAEALASGKFQTKDGSKPKLEQKSPPRFECGQCDKVFTRKASRVIHWRFSHGDGTGELRCRSCKREFKDFYREVRMEGEDAASAFVCTMGECTLNFDSLLELKKHHRSKCSGARETTEDLKDGDGLEELPLESTENPSGTPKKSRSKLVRHPKPTHYPCDKCDRHFRAKNHLLYHQRFSHGEGARKCRTCGLKYNDSAIPSEDPSKPTQYACSMAYCNLQFPNLIEFKQHHRLECMGVDGRLYERRNGRYQCTQCEKSYSSASFLKAHMNSIHEKKFRFVCDVCGKGFNVKNRLDKHIEYVHEKEKKYQCEFCEKKFITPCQLKYHRQRHLENPSYVCEQCGKAFYNIHGLKLHIDSVHSDKSVPCRLCGKLYASMQYVHNHILRTHKGQWRRWVATRKAKDRAIAESQAAAQQMESTSSTNP